MFGFFFVLGLMSLFNHFGHISDGVTNAILCVAPPECTVTRAHSTLSHYTDTGRPVLTRIPYCQAPSGTAVRVPIFEKSLRYDSARDRTLDLPVLGRTP